MMPVFLARVWSLVRNICAIVVQARIIDGLVRITGVDKDEERRYGHAKEELERHDWKSACGFIIRDSWTKWNDTAPSPLLPG